MKGGVLGVGLKKSDAVTLPIEAIVVAQKVRLLERAKTRVRRLAIKTSPKIESD